MGEGGGGMRREGNAASFPVQLHDVSGEEVGVVGSSLIADQDAARIVIDKVAGDDGMIGGHEVDALAAVHAFVGLENGDARAGAARETAVIFGEVIVRDGDAGGAGGEDAFVVGAGDGKPGDGDVRDPGVRRSRGAVDEDAVGLALGVDGGGFVAVPLQRCTRPAPKSCLPVLP